MAQTAATGDVLGEGGRKLRRQVGLAGLTMASVGSVIGSGWLFGAQTAAEFAGPSVLITWGVAAIVCIILALTYAELGAAYPLAGGTARYTFLTHGPLGGFFAGWVSWLQAVALAPVETVASLNYLSSNWWKGLTTSAGSQTVLTGRGIGVGILFVFFFTFVNLVGVRWLAESNNLIVAWKVAIPVLTIIAVLTQAFHTVNFNLHDVKGGGGFMPFGIKGMILALGGGVLFSYQGFEQAVQLGGESRNPKRDLPRAVVLSILVGTVVYIALQVCFLAATPTNLIRQNGWANLSVAAHGFGPFYQLATIVGLTWLATLLQVDAIVSPGGTAMVYMATTSRLSFALSRGGTAPRSLARLNRRRVPWVSLLLAAVVGCLLFLPFGSWAKLVNYITSATFFMYALAPIAVLAMRRAFPRGVEGEHRTYRVPFAVVWCPVAFILANLIVYWSTFTVVWHIAIGFLVGLILLGIGLLTGGVPEGQKLSWKGVAWVPVWVGGMVLITGIGSHYFGGRDYIPFGWDILVVAAFSIAIFYWAVMSSQPLAQIKVNMESVAEEAEIEEEVFGTR